MFYNKSSKYIEETIIQNYIEFFYKTSRKNCKNDSKLFCKSLFKF